MKTTPYFDEQLKGVVSTKSLPDFLRDLATDIEEGYVWSNSWAVNIYPILGTGTINIDIAAGLEEEESSA